VEASSSSSSSSLTYDGERGGGGARELPRVVGDEPQVVLADLLAVQRRRGGHDARGRVEVEVQPGHAHLQHHGDQAVLVLVGVLHPDLGGEGWVAVSRAALESIQDSRFKIQDVASTRECLLPIRSCSILLNTF